LIVRNGDGARVSAERTALPSPPALRMNCRADVQQHLTHDLKRSVIEASFVWRWAPGVLKLVPMPAAKQHFVLSSSSSSSSNVAKAWHRPSQSTAANNRQEKTNAYPLRQQFQQQYQRHATIPAAPSSKSREL
jgi:hypothetical protein